MYQNILYSHNMIQNVAKTDYLKGILPKALNLEKFFFLTISLNELLLITENNLELHAFKNRVELF